MDWKFLDAQRLWWLVAVAALVVGYIAVQFRRRRSAVRFSNVNLIDKIAPKSPGWKRHLVAALHLCALAVLVTAYARPQNEQRVPRERTTIILAIDTSLSMYATDVDPSRIESAKSAAYYAGWCASELNDELPSVASLAKSYCSEAYFHTTAENIQIHGGIGFTWEHPAHLYFKRAKSSELFLGDPTYHRELLAQRIGI